MPSGRSRSGSYFARHWKGELSLPRSFWINGIGILIAFGALTWGLGHILLGGGSSPPVVAAFIVTLLIVRFSVGTWQIVGIWRAATRRSARTGRRFWALLTKVVCLILAALVLYFNAFISLPMLDTVFNVMGGDKVLGPHAIRLLPGGTEVEFVGAITWGSAGELGKLLETHPEIRVIHLNSQGGRMPEADALRNLIQQHGLTTYTSGSCSSGCTVAFLGGRERWLGEGARLGFHQGRYLGLPGS